MSAAFETRIADGFDVSWLGAEGRPDVASLEEMELGYRRGMIAGTAMKYHD